MNNSRQQFYEGIYVFFVIVKKDKSNIYYFDHSSVK